MSLFRTGKSFIPNVNQVRCRSKLNIQRPKVEILPRRILKAVTEPILIPKKVDVAERCARKNTFYVPKRKFEVNEYEEFLFRTCQNDLDQNKMVIICQSMPCLLRDYNKTKNKFSGIDMIMVKINNKLMMRAITGTRRENLLPLLVGSSVYILSSDVRIKEAMTLLKKVNHLVVMGILTDDHILSHEDAVRLAQTDLETQRGQLVSLLGQGASKTYSLLNSHQSNLVRNLEQYIRQSDQSSPDQ
ncbi:hypothetical protein LOTGIDRAFT_239114 [Lottia gigantea]|uniref:Large ribosomal subunit protein uL10m n=1 Tax=Lottia gigantea TaxID=225164 RepID=V4AX06_LOTGI|nr:hypothetical protein LOTGIDRAFT_239114 [Lottia gigantea]ESO98071.1 hypothetical protein LOTGIDRAFT_239114 [Lottia gigantea]